MTGGTRLLFDILEWDSAFFSLRIGRVASRELSAGDSALLREQAACEEMDCIYFLADPSSAGTMDAAHRLGMRPVDVRVELSVRLPPAHSCDDSRRSGSPREPLASEADFLAELSGRLHDRTRFRADPGFDQARVTEMYRLWILKGLSGPGCGAVVAGPPGAPEGYCTYSTSGSEGRIELLGVDLPARGAGIGAMLVRAALADMAAKGAEIVRVATQGGSRASMSVYQSSGFRVESVGLWFHYWPAGA